MWPTACRDRELEALIAEHAYREPLWAQLITAYYLAGRQSDALDAYLRLKTSTARKTWALTRARQLRELYEQILRQEPLDVRKAAQISRRRHHVSSVAVKATQPDSPARRGGVVRR